MEMRLATEPPKEPSGIPKMKFKALPSRGSSPGPWHRNHRTDRRLREPADMSTRDSRVSSSSAAATHPVEEDDTVTKRKKEELHRKFVKKLGHPDSMARIKRLNSHIDDRDRGSGRRGRRGPR